MQADNVPLARRYHNARMTAVRARDVFVPDERIIRLLDVDGVGVRGLDGEE